MSKKETLKISSMGAPLHVPPTGSLWREMLILQSQWFIHSFTRTSVGAPKYSVVVRKEWRCRELGISGLVLSESIW